MFRRLSGNGQSSVPKLICKYDGAISQPPSPLSPAYHHRPVSTTRATARILGDNSQAWQPSDYGPSRPNLLFPWTGLQRRPCHSDATLQPDYTLRLSDVLTRVAIHLLKHHGLDILSFATEGLIRRPGRASHFVHYRPTWVPDWRNTEWVEGSHPQIFSGPPTLQRSSRPSCLVHGRRKTASIEAGRRRRRLYALNREMVHRT